MGSPATPTVSAPAAAAPSAPSTPAASSPTPATPSVPATPATPATPAGGAPGAAVPAAVPAAAPAAAAPKGPPQSKDYANDADGQTKFLRDLHAYDAEQKKPAGQPADKAAEAAAQPAAAQPGAQPDGAKPGEAAAAPPEAAPATPEGLKSLTEKVPELGQLLESKPEVKETLVSWARQIAEAAPILAIAPTLGDAQFLQKHASDLVALKTASMRAVDDPQMLGQALSGFDDQFLVVNEKGEPVLDAQGNKTYAPDRQVFVDGIVNRDLSARREGFTGEIAAIEQKLKGVYPNEAAKALDAKKLEALKYAELACQVVEQVRSGQYFEETPPEIPADASAEFRQWAEAERQRIADDKKRLEDERKGGKAQERQQQKAAFSGQVRGDMASNAGTVIGTKIKELVDGGAYIPQFLLQEMYVDPKTGQPTKVSAVVAKIFQQYENELMKQGSRSALDITQHELLPMNDETRALRRGYYERRSAEIIPRLVNQWYEGVKKSLEADQAAQADRAGKRAAAAQPEPQSAGSTLPAGASEQQITAAAEDAAKKLPEWKNASPSERQGMILTQRHRMSGGYQKR